MSKNCVKIEKIRMWTSGKEVVLKIRTQPDKGKGWFKNPSFWRTSFVDGPLAASGWLTSISSSYLGTFAVLQPLFLIFQLGFIVKFLFPLVYTSLSPTAVKSESVFPWLIATHKQFSALAYLI